MECLLKQYRPFQEFPAILANTKKEISVENNLISFASEQRNVVVVREEKKIKTNHFGEIENAKKETKLNKRNSME